MQKLTPRLPHECRAAASSSFRSGEGRRAARLRDPESDVEGSRRRMEVGAWRSTLGNGRDDQRRSERWSSGYRAEYAMVGGPGLMIMSRLIGS
jgi:hypothetical protein